MYKNTDIERAAKILQAYLGDYRRGLHVREVAKRLKISPSAVSYMAINLEKKRIMNHVTEGRNKKYFINLENPAAKVLLTAAEIAKKNEVMEKYFIIKKLINEVHFNSSVALLFGSFAKGIADNDSDIDVVFIGTGNASLKKKLERFSGIYNKKMQMISMNKNDFMVAEKREFIKEILKNHVVINGTEEFVNMVWGVYHPA